MLESITLQGTYEEMGEQYGRRCANKIRSFAKMSRMMASLAHKPGSRPFDPNLWYLPMHRIASDHSDEADGTAGKSICQHAKLLRYNFQTLVSFVAQPRHRTFWVVDGCPCNGREIEVNFED
jgi:hypothetical protein